MTTLPSDTITVAREWLNQEFGPEIYHSAERVESLAKMIEDRESRGRHILYDLFGAGFNIFVEAKRSQKRSRPRGVAPISWRYLDVLRNCLRAVNPDNPELK